VNRSPETIRVVVTAADWTKIPIDRSAGWTICVPHMPGVLIPFSDTLSSVPSLLHLVGTPDTVARFLSPFSHVARAADAS
jgi:hypothetical protein